MTKKPLTLLAAVLLTALAHVSPALAADDGTPEGNFQKFYRNYLMLYSEEGKEKEFLKASEQLQNYYLERDSLDKYFKVRLNEALYDTEHNQAYRAITKANKMLEDMKAASFERYDMVYQALGTVFESRGSYRMAEYYYTESLKSIDPEDVGSLVGVYSRLAYLYMLYKPREARQWNERLKEPSQNFPAYYQVYLFIDGVINFSFNNKAAFQESYRKYNEHREHHPELDNYGVQTMEVINSAFSGHYADALARVDSAAVDLNEISLYYLRMRIYIMQNKYQEALSVIQARSKAIDSLNTDMLFNNLNEIHAQTGVARLQSELAAERGNMLVATIALLSVIIIMLALWIVFHRRMRKHLIEKNEQLKSALTMAEESDRMKTEFVRQVSHEIRTPLNAIVGFNEVLNNSEMTLGEDERRDLVDRIKQNTNSLTNIVNEMLHLSEKESADYYAKSDTIPCNKFFSEILYRNRDSVSASIDLDYTTQLLNRFTVQSNAKAVETILDHLIQNAIKFTRRGSIKMHARLTDDGRQLLVSVSDTGRGIPTDVRPRIFDQFFKVDHFKEGIGLGLTVSKKIAQKLDGDLALDEAYNDGARFVLTLPVGEKDAAIE